MKILPYKGHSDPFHPLILKSYNQSRNITARYGSPLPDIRLLDLYFLLGLDHFRGKPIPPAVLNFCYRQQVLRYHPDRQHDKHIFLALTRAREILASDYLRRKYDQYYMPALAADDRDYTEAEFLQTFGQKFAIIERFALRPMAPLERPEEFYRSWRAFESTRNFEFWNLAVGEEIDQRLMRKMRNEHLREVREFVDFCRRKDPRIAKTVPKGVDARWSEDDVKLLRKLGKVCVRNRKVDAVSVAKKLNKPLKDVIDKIRELKL